MKKIAIFQKDLDVGGIQKSLINTLNILNDKYDIDLYLYSKETGFYIDKIPSKINVIYMGESKRINQLIPFSIYNFFNKKKYMGKKYDFSIDFNGYQNNTACGAINVDSKKRIIWIHNDLKERYFYDKKYRYLYKFGKSKYKYFDTFVFVSEGVKSSFFEMEMLKNKKNIVIGNQIDDDVIIEKSDEKCDLVVDKDKYNIVTVGRMVYAKGFDILINDMNRLLEFRNDFHLYFLGDGIERENLINLTHKLNLDNYITFLGSKKNPYKYMNLMDGFALTSRYEGQGMVILEAKTIGLDLFISKNLEKYNEGEFVGYSDIVDGLKKAKKKIKKKKRLDEYNNKNENKLLSILK